MSHTTFFFSLIFLTVNAFAGTDQFLCNYLGTGTAPKLSLHLSNNGGTKWGSYEAGYQNCMTAKGATIPTNPGLRDKWSTWDIRDEKNNYYGTVTLQNNGSAVVLEKYSVEAKKGYRLEGL